MSKYGEWSIPQLKNELRKRNAKVSGRKRELVERLDCYDRNFNFGYSEPCDEEHNFNMQIPDPTAYKDVNKDSKIPDVTTKGIEAFFQQFEKVDDGKAEAMYYSKFLHSLRYICQDSCVFVTGRVAAEMKKSVVYKVDMKLDVHGIIQETQCECSVGLGPEAHCKHVSLVLFALSKKKDGIVTKMTCTQVLQTFHQVKKYDGSPICMSAIKLRKTGSLKHIKDFDPRPTEHRNVPQYPVNFRNTWLNSQAEDIPIRQMYVPANICAIVKDHDYLELPQEEYFLQNLSVTTITTDEKTRLETYTRAQSTSRVWKEERTKRIHASNYGRVCKAGVGTDMDKMARSLTTVSEFFSKPTNYGLKYEAVAIKDYSSKTGNVVNRSGIQVCEHIPYLGCSPDGLIGDDGVIEVKCPYTCKDSTISPTTVPYLVMDSCGTMSLKENHNYYYQVQGNLLCTSREWCDFVVWTMKDIQIIRIQKDEGFVEQMKIKLKQFFDQYFKKVLLEKNLYRGTDKYTFS